MSEVHIITGKSARRAAVQFNIGNMISLGIPTILITLWATGDNNSILLPALSIPIIVLWLFGSMLVYAFHRHHPNKKVGEYTQKGAYRYYAITGTLVAMGFFIPQNEYTPTIYATILALSTAVIVPLSLRDIRAIYKDTWEDVNSTSDTNE